MKLQDLKSVKTSIKCAQQISFLSNHPDFKLGAVIVKNGKIISKAFNESKTHTYVKKFGEHYNQSIHAELACIFKVKNRELLRGATIVVYRERRDGNMANSRPCPMCYSLIQECGIKRIIFTSELGIQVESVLFDS